MWEGLWGSGVCKQGGQASGRSEESPALDRVSTSKALRSLATQCCCFSQKSSSNQLTSLTFSFLADQMGFLMVTTRRVVRRTTVS